MGKVEKVIVLGVLALIVGILVVSLTLDDPLKKDKVAMAGGNPAPAPAPKPPAQGPSDAPSQTVATPGCQPL